MINSAARSRAAGLYDMYVRDKSVPTSALTNTQAENQDAVHRRPARDDDRPPERVRGDGRSRGQGDRAPTRSGRRSRRQHALRPDPEGPARRAVVFGGSNIHIFTDEA